MAIGFHHSATEKNINNDEASIKAVMIYDVLQHYGAIDIFQVSVNEFWFITERNYSDVLLQSDKMFLSILNVEWHYHLGCYCFNQ